MAIDLRQEIANYLLNNCFIIGKADAMKEKYYYVINHEEAFQEVFRPLGYTVVIHRNLRVIQLINNLGLGKVSLRKYDSIILLILRLIYIQKQESLSSSGDIVIANVNEIKSEYENLNLPRKFDQKLLEDAMINIKKYNLAMPLDKLGDLEARIQIYPSVMLALPDSSLTSAYETTRQYLQNYVDSKEEEETL